MVGTLVCVAPHRGVPDQGRPLPDCGGGRICRAKPESDCRGNTLCVGFPDPSCLRGGFWPQSLSRPATEAPRAAFGDRLGGRGDGSKIWPNTMKVRIHERVPVAFVHLRPNPKDGMSQFALIDKDGYILRPRVAAKFTLPVITGVRESESAGEPPGARAAGAGNAERYRAAGGADLGNQRGRSEQSDCRGARGQSSGESDAGRRELCREAAKFLGELQRDQSESGRMQERWICVWMA